MTYTLESVLDYYPYGKTLRSYTPTTPPERYQSTHNERDPETNYDHREARNSDSGWGRFLGVDALAGEYAVVSPYCYVMGNPVRMVDMDGRDTSFADNNARKQFNYVVDKINKEANEIAEKIAELQEKAEAGKNVSKKIRRLQTRLNIVTSIKKVYDDILASEIMVHFISLPNPGGAYLSGGATYFNHKDNRLEVKYRFDNYNSLVHESRHARGYMLGEWGSVPNPENETQGTPIYYDYQDEYESYYLANQYSIYFGVYTPTPTEEIIRRTINDIYSKRDFITKEFHQYYVPK